MAEDARKWVAQGTHDARPLSEALANRRYPLILHQLARLEQRRHWLLDTADNALRRGDDLRLSDRDVRWLAELVSQKNRDEGDIRFCAIDLSWRRLCIESYIRAGDLEDARIALTAYFTSDTSDRRKIYLLQPDGLQHVIVFANAYDAYIAKAEAAQKKGQKAPRWPFTGLPNDGSIDVDVLDKMSKDWALCVLRQLRRMSMLLHEVRPQLLRLVAQQSPMASTSQSQSQDSLPTPGPSSDGFGAASTSARQVEDRASPRKRRRTVSPEGSGTRCREDEEAVEALRVEVVVEAEETIVEMDVEAGRAPTPEPPAIAVHTTESSPAPAPSLPSAPPVQQRLPASPRRSPRLSPSPQPAPAPRAGSIPPSPGRSPRARARSPIPLAAPTAFLAPPSHNDDSDALPESQLPPTKPFPTDIFSLLAKGAAEQDQKLRSSHRLSEPAAPVKATPVPHDVESDEMAQAAKPSAPVQRTPPPAKALGPSASTILMPPPPATSKGKGLTESPAALARSTAPAAASSQDSVEPSSAEPSTLPSDISAAANLSSGESQSQSQPQGADDPLPGQHASDRSGVVPPLTGFTASTTASPAEISFDTPTPAQGAKQLVPDTPESSAPPAKAAAEAAEAEAPAAVAIVSQSTQSSSSGSATSNHVSDSQPSSNGDPNGSRSAAIVSSLDTAASSQPNPFTQPILSTRPLVRGNSVQPIVNAGMAALMQPAGTGLGSNSSQQSSFGSDTSALTYLSHTEMERIQEEALAAQRAKEAEAEERREREERDAAEELQRQAERELLESQQDEASLGYLGTDEDDDDLSVAESLADASAGIIEAHKMDIDKLDNDMPLSQEPVTQAIPSTQADAHEGTTPEDASPIKGRARGRSFVEVESEAEDDDGAGDIDVETDGFLEFVSLDGNE